MELLAVGIIVPSVLIGLVAFITYSLVTQATKQSQGYLTRLDDLENAIGQLVKNMPKAGENAPTPGGLELGVPAPNFALPALTGDPRTVSLEEWRGRRVLLMFFRPGCSFCQQMAPDLAALPVDGRDGYPIPLVVTTGEEPENREFIAKYDIRATVLLQPGDGLYAPYQVQGTPMGYLVDEQGKIASSLLAGADALLAAFRGSVAASENGHQAATIVESRVGLKTTRSRLQREGLAAGTRAPDFSLPSIDGAQVSLADFRGRPVLLVFSDPECLPCQALAPELEQLNRSSNAFQVLMVSRGDLAANRAKAAEHGLTFPLVLQRHWEVSRDYAMFKTPVGYLVGSDGVLESDVAVGGDAIVALARHAAARVRRHDEEVVARE